MSLLFLMLRAFLQKCIELRIPCFFLKTLSTSTVCEDHLTWEDPGIFRPSDIGSLEYTQIFRITVTEDIRSFDTERRIPARIIRDDFYLRSFASSREDMAWYMSDFLSFPLVYCLRIESYHKSYLNIFLYSQRPSVIRFIVYHSYPTGYGISFMIHFSRASSPRVTSGESFSISVI